MLDINQKKLFIFDMDGTIYLDNMIFERALDLFSLIRKKGADYVFLTNNSSKSRKDYLNKLNFMGVDVDLENIFSSTLMTIHYLKQHYPDKLFFVLGTNAMVEEMKEAGLNVLTNYNESVDAVVIGYDTELNYQKLVDASKLINLNKPYIATHPDLVCPVKDGYVPDCGALIELFFAATKRRPTIIGKPHPRNIEFILQNMQISKENAVVIGDRLYTDIKMGIDANLDTILVLSGETKKEDLKSASIKPTLVIDHISKLYQMLKI
jgi:HAD superfamily hydrolase (TIGR01457 family)